MAMSARTVKTARKLLVAFAPQWSRLKPHHLGTGVLLVIALAIFGFTVYDSVHRFGNRLERLERLETNGPQ